MKDETKKRPTLSAKELGLFLLPVLALGVVIAFFLAYGLLPSPTSTPPVESLAVERYALRRGEIELHVRNTGPGTVTIAQVIINDAVWPFEAAPSNTIARLGTAAVQLKYKWSPGEAYSIRLLSTNSIPLDVSIPVAVMTAAPSTRTFLGFTLIGVYVGVIPVFLGILWFPALRRIGRKTFSFLLAATIGLLLFLGIDTLFEAREASLALPDAFQGVGLIAMGGVFTIILLEAISAPQRTAAGSLTDRRLAIASTVALGIGFHNLGEGLAIGAAYNLGEIALGKFLVVGFILQNITEGLGVVAPIIRDNPSVKRLAILGLVAGVPAILGAWIGGYAPSSLLAVTFLAIGAGAIFQVLYQVWRLLRQDLVAQSSPYVAYSGVAAGMLLLWVTGLLIK